MSASTVQQLFAVTAPGIESITLGELKRLGLKGKIETGGVSFEGNREIIYATNLWLRTASRVVVRLARFHASSFHELERRARRVEWSPVLPGRGTVRVRATCRKSRLYHSDAVAERVREAIARSAAPAAATLAPSGDDDADENAETSSGQLIVVRIVDDECEISADSSGELLHRRGYRQETGKAPLRETLAAAMLLASGWRPPEALVDPLCGSGTIPIEAALLARGVAPGLRRKFAFMEWPTFQEDLWTRLIADAEKASARDRSGPAPITGADRDRGGVAAAIRNAERADVANDIEFVARSISDSLRVLDDLSGGGWILTNPPYGERVGERSKLRDLYARLGSALESAPSWRLGLLTADPILARQTGLTLRARFSTRNGGIPVAFFAQDKVPGEARRNLSRSGVGRTVDE